MLGDAPSMIRHKRKHSTVFDWMTAQSLELNSPIVQLFLKPFFQPVVVITDPREAHHILLRRAKDFDRSNYFRDPYRHHKHALNAFGGVLANNHMIQPTNDKFRQGRRLLGDTMTTGFLNKVAAPSLHRHVLNLLELWRLQDQLWHVAFGSQLECLPTETGFLSAHSKFNTPAAADQPMVFPTPEYNSAVKSMKVIIDTLESTVTSPMPRQTHWLISLTPSDRRARAHKDQLIRERLEDAKSRILSLGEKAGEFADVTSATDHMVRREAEAAAKENRAPQYESPIAKDEMFGFLIAGHESTTTALMWTVKHMTNHPRVVKKLRGILRGHFGHESGPPTVEQITTTNIPYLDAVVEEIEQCALTGAGIIQTAVHGTMLLGHRIPKGVDVFMMTNGPGYMAPNTINETIPEHVRSESSRDFKDRARWIKADKKGVETFDPNAGPAMQFGGGIRSCFGNKMAYLEMRVFVALLVWTFDLEAVPEQLRGFEAFNRLTHKPKQCYVVLREAGKAH
ncbi:hypothetical protein KVR01_008913 [Diaporthe batatas]|uniref:uncharacterized protein n=1 Tax=Diaporthe batatas TaxID=748121 RepID=UPI001D03F3E8|nr:uncharacterized protein KVR01_008913 [Diaporthe batatas]KAG8160649.1 hypothetical protein KVR01_008913 [Diaporthe batatas]